MIDESRAATVYSEAELNRLILIGMTIADVTNKFGLPGSAINIKDNTILLTYMFPFKERQETGPYLTGFGIDIKDGRVIRWSPVTGMTGATIQGGESQELSGELFFQIFVASDSHSNLVNTVDSQGIADGNDLKTAPELTFKAKLFTGISGRERPGEQTVILVLSEFDASNLKDLTEDNFGKRLLIVCRKQVIAAPMISAPLAARQLMFTVKNSSVLNNIKSK